MASTKLTKTFSSDGNRKKYTISFWVKRGTLGNQFLINTDGGNEETYLRFKGEDNLQWFEQNSSAATQANRSTNQLFRDVHGWSHIVIARDSTLGTANDRLKLYVNGTLNTSWSENTTPAQDTNTRWNKNVEHMIGVGGSGSSNYFDGSMSHIHFCDGYTYAASDFGETDATTGEWKIKTSPSVTYGTNGFFILKDGNSVTDQSGNSNNFTVAGGTLTKTEDCPSNVFATMNPLDNQNQASQFTNGNTKVEWHHDNKNIFATLAMNAGKYYWEMKYVLTSGGTNAMIGISKCDSRQADDYAGHDANSWSYYASSGQKYHGTGVNYGNTWSTDDIIGVAFDADTRTIWFSKNGTWQNSATISEIAAGTTTNSAYTGIGTAGEFFIPCISAYDQNKVAFNFGNGYFSTTAVSSAGTNASGIGIFEYDVPTNFTALSTKGLNL